jgi:hypothetical protein
MSEFERISTEDNDGHDDDDHDLFIREEPCGCVRISCSRGHSPQQIVEAVGLTLEDLLCAEHRGSP